jgi:NADH-quinone oxidoreductase subunit K
MPIIAYLILASILFAISLAGVVINRKNVIVLLMCIELLLLAVNFNFVTFAQYFQAAAGEIFVFFILTVAAAESAIGLAILVLYYRKNNSINVQTMDKLKG